MICTNCGVEITADSEFCEACGIRLVVDDDCLPEVSEIAKAEPGCNEGEKVEHVREEPEEPVLEEQAKTEPPVDMKEQTAASEASGLPAEMQETIKEEIKDEQSETSPKAPKTLVGAGVGVRFAATVIDLVVLSILIKYLTAPFQLVLTMGPGMVLSGGALWISLLVVFIYYLSMEAWLGGTAGKILLGLKVVMQDGSKVTFDAAALRTFMRVVDGFLFYLIAAIFVWNSPVKQRFGDRVARTLVVSRREFSGV